MFTSHVTCFPGKKAWSLADVTGAVPQSRSAATMAAVGNNLYLFGGLSRETGWFDTMHKYDTGKLQINMVIK